MAPECLHAAPQEERTDGPISSIRFWAILIPRWVSFLGKTRKTPEIVAVGELGLGGRAMDTVSSVSWGESLLALAAD